MNAYEFSYKNYVNMLNIIKHKGTLCDYSEITGDLQGFIILRHDIEFSPQRALALAELEHKENVSSSYFFQVSNNAYNIMSSPNIDRIQRINELGHHIGLHFHLHGSADIDEIKQRISYEIKLLSDVTGISIDRFSFHRPSSLVLKNHIIIPGIINTYDPMYFTYAEDVSLIDLSKSVKYIADSRSEWNYVEPWDFPCEEFFEKYPKVQVLCHPYSWSEAGYSTLDNLKSIIEENRLEYIDTLNQETKYVKDYLSELV